MPGLVLGSGSSCDRLDMYNVASLVISPMESRLHDNDDRHDPKLSRVSTHPLSPMKQFAARLPKSDTGPHSGCHCIESIAYQSCLDNIGRMRYLHGAGLHHSLPALLAGAGGCNLWPPTTVLWLAEEVRPNCRTCSKRDRTLDLTGYLSVGSWRLKVVVTFLLCRCDAGWRVVGRAVAYRTPHRGGGWPAADRCRNSRTDAAEV